MVGYKITARDYLARANALRASGGPDALFYAALEVRFGIEARLNEYLEGAAKTARVKKGLWQIRLLNREVEGVFDAYTKAVVATFTNPDSNEKVKVEYTPVTADLRKVGERLGDFLHFSAAHQEVARGSLVRLEALVDAGIKGLTFATRGTLLGPPTNPGAKDNQIRFRFEKGAMPAFLRTGSEAKFSMTFTLISKDAGKIVLKPA